MADEYIKREDAIAKPFRFYWRNGVLSNPVVSVRTIKEISAADVVPVRHGKWILKDDGRAHCSMCNTPGNSHVWNYCPNCGAKMDGGEAQ